MQATKKKQLLYCVFSLSYVRHFGCQTVQTPWTVAHQDPVSMEFARQEYCSGLPFPTPGDLLKPGIELQSPGSPTLIGGFFLFLFLFYHCPTWEAQLLY